MIPVWSAILTCFLVCGIFSFIMSRVQARCAADLKRMDEACSHATVGLAAACFERDIYKKVTKNLYRAIALASPERQGTNAILRAFIDGEECEYAKTPKGQCKTGLLDYQGVRCIVCEARWRMIHPELAPSVKAS